MRYNWNSKRKTPYTYEAVLKNSCCRCGNQAHTQWQICSDNRLFRPMCVECDVELNRMVLEFVGHPDRDALLEEYEKNIREILGLQSPTGSPEHSRSGSPDEDQ